MQLVNPYTGSSGTIFLGSATTDKTLLEITGGEIENTADGTAVCNRSFGTVSISGGRVSAKEGIAMLVTALANADVSGCRQSSFTDVKSDAYYMGYIEWASKNSIVNGTGNRKFSPDQSINREPVTGKKDIGGTTYLLTSTV